MTTKPPLLMRDKKGTLLKVLVVTPDNTWAMVRVYKNTKGSPKELNPYCIKWKDLRMP